MLPDDILCLGVVPVFVNAGAALLPAIVAVLTNVASLLLRPRDLWRACRARPRTATATVASIIAVCGVAAWMFASPAAGQGQRRKTSNGDAATPFAHSRLGIDWAAVAHEWLRQGDTASATRPSASSGDFIFGGNLLRNGYLGGGSPLGLRASWEFPMRGTQAAKDLEGAGFLSSPAMVGDVVYGASCLVDAVGNYGTVFCLDATSGRMQWTTSSCKDAEGKEQPFRGVFSSPAITADGRALIVGQGLHEDEKCELLCLETRSGQVRWHVPTPLHIEGSPAIEGDLVVVGAGAVEDENHRPKGHAGLVLAVRISTGEKLWEYPLSDPESSPAVAGGVVYIGSGFNGQAVVALRTETGEELNKRNQERVVWRTPTPHPATGAVTLTDNLVIVGCGNGDYVYTDPHPNGAILALDRKTGGVRWQLQMPDSVLGKVAVRDGRAIVAVRNGELLCLDLNARGGAGVLWRQRVHDKKALLAGPAFTGDYVYAVAQDGLMAVLDAKDGRVVERHSLNAQGRPGENGLSVSSPLVASGRVYVGSETGGLRCFAGREVKP